MTGERLFWVFGRRGPADPSRSVRELLDTFLSLGLAGAVARLEGMQELL